MSNKRKNLKVGEKISFMNNLFTALQRWNKNGKNGISILFMMVFIYLFLFSSLRINKLGYLINKLFFFSSFFSFSKIFLIFLKQQLFLICIHYDYLHLCFVIFCLLEKLFLFFIPRFHLDEKFSCFSMILNMEVEKLAT